MLYKMMEIESTLYYIFMFHYASNFRNINLGTSVSIVSLKFYSMHIVVHLQT